MTLRIAPHNLLERASSSAAASSSSPVAPRSPQSPIADMNWCKTVVKEFLNLRKDILPRREKTSHRAVEFNTKMLRVLFNGCLHQQRLQKKTSPELTKLLAQTIWNLSEVQALMMGNDLDKQEAFCEICHNMLPEEAEDILTIISSEEVVLFQEESREAVLSNIQKKFWEQASEKKYRSTQTIMTTIYAIAAELYPGNPIISEVAFNREMTKFATSCLQA